jgi:hypothetical protein
MYNIKIKSVPNRAKTGSQLDYSLVDRNTLFLKPDTQVQSDVKNTISAVPREKANIEAEGGETIVGDTNNDGFLEHQTIVGKRHSKGGVPLNVPEGSFIFSDTDKLRIKDPEILKMFGMAPNKKGYTPAEIAKKYQVNDYMAILKDDTKDKYSKETAQVMLDSNLKKLGMLALVQESMKGFPDGVPAIAESVMEGLMGGGAAEQQEEEQQGQPEARYGGIQLPKAQDGKTYGQALEEERKKIQQEKDAATTEAEPDWDLSEDTMLTAPGAIPLDEVVVRQQKLSAIPKIGDVYYVDGQPIKVSDIEMSSTGDWLPNWLNDPQGIYFSPAGTTDYGSKNKKYYLTFDEFKKLRELDPQTGNAPVLRKHGRTASSWWTADDNRAYNFSTVPTSQPTRYYGSRDNNIAIDQNDILELPNGKYKIIDTQYGVGERNPLVEPKGFFLPQQYLETIRVKNLTTGQIEELRLDELKEKLDAGFAKNLTKYPEAATTNPDGTPATGEWNITGNDSTEVNSMGVEEEVKDKEVGKTATVPVVKKPKVNPSNNSSNANPTFGGFNPSFGGFETPTDTIRGYAYGGSMYKMQVGGTPRFNPDTGMWQNYDAQGKPVGAPYKGTGTTYNVKDKDLQEKARAAGYEIIGNKYAPNINYVPEQTSKTGFKWNPESGYYESSQLPIGKQGLEETINIWKDELDQYSGPSGKGAEAWRKDFIGQKGKEGPASKYLVDKANEYSVAAGAGPQVDVTQKAAYVPGQDVFSLKKFKKSPAQVEQKTEEIKKDTGVDVQQKTITPSITNKTRGFFTPDMLILANNFGRRIANEPPTLRQAAFQTGPYNLLSPEGEIAKIQSSGNMLSNQAANTMAGNVGFGASMGVQGQAIDKVTDTQGKYSNANVGISNEASRLGSGVFNQGQLANTQLLSAFDRDSAIYGQNLVNSINAKNLGITRAFNKGWDNSFKANMLEDMFPQVGIDRVYGDIGWSGVGRDYHTYDTYINPLTAAASSKGRRTSQDFDWDDDDWKEMSAFTNKGIENGLSKDQAYALASKMVMAKKSRNNAYDPYNPAQSVYAGLGSMGWDNTDR